MPHIHWTSAASPVMPDAAGTVDVHGRIVHQLAAAHDIQPGVAAVLIRPMLWDLIRSGTWERRGDNGQYRLSEDDCHRYVWQAPGTARPCVMHYEAFHADAACPNATSLPDVPAETWMPHFLDSGHLLRGNGQPWRHVLATASQLPVTLIRTAMRYFALHRFHISRIRPDMFTTVFFAMADEAVAVHKRWSGLPGNAFIPDSTGLIWQLSSHRAGSNKPAITSVLSSIESSTRRPDLQQARRTPTPSRRTSPQRLH
ncbi:hypothetical protein [Streptomyces sp. NPDC001642]|uniref:hypothetical protein n=1 Tax=Streptomyces sp. NPDC001642 TaxID=3154392 RepID=UPI003316A4B1